MYLPFEQKSRKGGTDSRRKGGTLLRRNARLLFLLSGFCGAGASAENLFFNGSFEAGTGGYALQRHLRPDTNPERRFIPKKPDRREKVSGETSLRLENPFSEEMALLCRSVFLKKETAYRLSAMVKSDCGGTLTLRTEFRHPVLPSRTFRKEFPVGKEWRKIEMVFQTGKSEGAFITRIRRGPVPGTVWIDDLTLTRLGDPSSEYDGLEITFETGKKLHLRGERAETGVWIHNAGKADFSGEIELTLADDYFKTTRPLPSLPLHLPAGQSIRKTVSVPLDRYGAFQLIPGVRGAKMRFYPGSFCVTGRYKAEELDLRKDFCVAFNGGVDLDRSSGVLGYRVIDASPEERFAMLAKMGCRLLRSHDDGLNVSSWAVFEPEEGNFRRDLIRYAADLHHRHGIAMLPVLLNSDVQETSDGKCRFPAWLAERCRKTSFRKRTIFLPPPDNFRRYVRAFAETARPGIRFYEVMNEPQFSMDAKTYLPYLRIAWEELKKADRTNFVLGISSTNDHGDEIGPFLRECLESGGAENLDAVSFHPYAARRLGSPQRADRMLDQLKKQVRKYTKAPLWNTELYYLHDRPRLSPADHFGDGLFEPHHAATRFLTDLGEGIRQSICVTVAQLWKRDLFEGYRSWNGSQWNPSANAAAYNALARFFEGARPLHRFEPVPGVVCYVYRRKNAEAAAAIWNAFDRTVYTVDPGTAAVTDLFGNPLSGNVKISGAPLYFFAGKTDPETFIAHLKKLKLVPDRTVDISPAARLLLRNGRRILRMGVFNRTADWQRGILSLNSGTNRSFSIPGSGYAAVDLPATENETEGTVICNGNERKFSVVPHPAQVVECRKNLPFRSSDGLLSASFSAERAGNRLLFRIRVGDTTDSGEENGRVPWDQDSIELFLDPEPDVLPMNHAEAWRESTARILLLPRIGRSGKTVVPETLHGVETNLVRTKDGYEATIALPADLPGFNGREFGVEVKVNDAPSPEEKTLRSASLFGSKEAYRNRLEFGIVDFSERRAETASPSTIPQNCFSSGQWTPVSEHGWTAVSDRVRRLFFRSPVKTGTFYALSFESRATGGSLQENPGLALDAGNQFHPTWTPSQEWTRQTVFFHSGERSAVNYVFHTKKSGTPGTLSIRNVTLSERPDEWLRENGFFWDFEQDSSVPADWRIREKGNFSLAVAPFREGSRGKCMVLRKADRNSVSISSQFLPGLAGQEYEFSFFARGERQGSLRVLIQHRNPDPLRNEGAPFSIVRDFNISPQWKEYTVRFTFPEDKKNPQEFANRMFRILLFPEHSMFFDDIRFTPFQKRNP